MRRLLLAGLLLLATCLGLPTPARATTALPCDIYRSAGTPCVAAHSTVRALISAYNGPLYQLTRASDKATHDVGLLTPGRSADAADHDAFCAGTTCVISKVYDQTANHNDLAPGPGTITVGDPDRGPDRPADAGALAVTAGGHKAYGIWITPGVGYRNSGVARGVALNGQPEGMYMVASGTHVNKGCCFDYGNAESQPHDTSAASMDAVNLSTECFFGSCSGTAPWVAADLEDGLFQGGTSSIRNTGTTSPYVTAMLKNDGRTKYALKGGNSQSGGLQAYGETPLPAGYAPMKQQGGIILGVGGDNSNWATGTFFEGVMTAGYPSDAADNAVQANIVSVGYAGQTSVPNEPFHAGAGTGATIVDNNGATVVYALGSDGEIYEDYQRDPGAGNWSGWDTALADDRGYFVGAPSVFVDKAGHTVVTAIDARGNVMEDYQTNPGAGPWSGWHYYTSSLPSGVKFIGTPFATKDVNGVNVTYATGSDGHVYENYLTPSAGWSGWELNPGSGGSFVSSPSVFVDATGHTVMTAIDATGDLQEDYQTNPGNGPWSGWHHYSYSPLPTGVKFVGTPFSTKDAHGTNITYVTGSDGHIYENYHVSGGGWAGWNLNLGSTESFASSPSVFVDPNGHTVVTAIGATGNVMENHQTNPGGGPWSGWHTSSPLPNGVTFAGVPNALTDKNGTDITYVLGSDGNVYENYITPAGTWFGWELALGTHPRGMSEF